MVRRHLPVLPSSQVIASIGKLMMLAVEVNTYTTADVFIDFSGHVDQIEVGIHRDGWKSYQDPTYKYKIDISADTASAQVENINNAIRKMKNILKSNNTKMPQKDRWKERAIRW